MTDAGHYYVRPMRRAVIVGGGIAGPVLGMFLRRIGMDAVICEARPTVAGGEGAFLGVAPNGMNVLDELGLRPAIEAISFPCHGFEFQNARGERIAGIDRSADLQRFGARLKLVRRSDLHRALTAAAMDQGVPVHFGRKLEAIETRSDAVKARFEDGSEEEGDLLVGCDGIRSTTRRLVLPDAPAPTFSGLVDHAGFARCPEAPLEPGLNVMVFGRRAFFGAFKTPAGEVWWFHNAGQKRPDHAPRDPEALRASILELHREDPPWIRRVVEATPEVLGPYPLHDILSLPRWHHERVCLIGDAAHSTTPNAGQGASLAMEDAIVLAQCLRDETDPARAFDRFERARRQRVETIVRQSRQIGNTKAVSNSVAEWFRDRLLPIFLRFGAKAQSQQYAHRIV